MVIRKHFEAMVFTYLAEELRTGDIAITGAWDYADWRAMLLPWEECEPLLEGFCASAGLPATAPGFTERPGTPTWTRPPRWTPGTRTTPTW